VLADGYYSKTKFINGVQALGLQLVCKLRQDANLRWLYQGPQKKRGRPKQYDGKVQFLQPELVRFESVGTVDGIQLYTGVSNSVHFKRNIRIVYLIKPVGDRLQTARLFSTDTNLAALEIYRLSLYRTKTANLVNSKLNFYQAAYSLEVEKSDFGDSIPPV